MVIHLGYISRSSSMYTFHQNQEKSPICQTLLLFHLGKQQCNLSKYNMHSGREGTRSGKGFILYHYMNVTEGEDGVIRNYRVDQQSMEKLQISAPPGFFSSWLLVLLPTPNMLQYFDNWRTSLEYWLLCLQLFCLWEAAC